MIYVLEEKIETAGPNFLIVCLTHNVSVRETGQGFDRHRIETISWEICAIHLQRRQNRNFQKYPWKGHLKEGRGGVSSKTVTFSANKWQSFCKVWSSINSKPCTTFTDCVADVVLQCTMVRMLSHVAQWLLLCETWHQHYHIHATYVSLHIFIHVAHNKYAWTNSSKANYQCNSFSLHICTDADQSLTTRFLNCRPAQCTVHSLQCTVHH